MAHPRTLIRNKVVELLVDETAAGDRVMGTRVEPHRKNRLPAISVYMLSEAIDVEASRETAPRQLVREAKVEVVGWVLHSAARPVDVAMDELAEEIEAAMTVDPTLGGLAEDCILDDTLLQVLDDDGSDPLVGIVTLTYAVTYRTSTAVDASTLDNFLRVKATHELEGGVDDTVPASDEFVVQETPP